VTAITYQPGYFSWGLSKFGVKTRPGVAENSPGSALGAFFFVDPSQIASAEILEIHDILYFPG